VDSAQAAAIPGVTVARDGDLVAVLHADPDRAAFALARVKATWAPAPEGADQEGIFDELVAKATAPPQVRASKGNVDAVPLGSRRFENTYRKSYVAHAPIEPHTALAVMEGGRLTVWASTQTPFPLQDQVAAATGLDKKAVRIIPPFVGGGFGGKSAGPQAIEAARLARLTGKPVQVAFTREEEFFYDYLDPACVVKIVSALDGQGRITLWDYDVYYAGARAAELFYDVPNVRLRTFGARASHRFGTGPWRAPGANMNVFARESQIDVMATAAGIDPLELRLRNTSDPRARGVCEAAAKAFGWTPHTAPRNDGTGIGIAAGIDSGTYVALAVQVKVDRTSGDVRVERVVCAQDMGVVVNPEGAKMQIEGCITMGLGYALTEELQFRGGEVLTQNYDTYELPRFSWLPKIEAVLVTNDALPPQGGGEPAIVPMGGAIANAVFDATGVRVLRLPIARARLKAALSGA
jgi:isoquinoline 1-oxidoreductase